MSQVIRSAYDGVSTRVVKKCPTSRTKQSFKKDCDVNNILKKYRRQLGKDFLDEYHGFISGRFGDASYATGYQDALNVICASNEAFDALPSALRARFGNDPLNMLEFVGNKDNKDEAIKLGLLKKEVKPPENTKTP